MKTVEGLIDPITNSWDENLLRENFLPVDVERILRIPLSEHLSDDCVAWQLTKKHMFSVRSAYYAEWELQFGARTRRRDG